MAALQDGISATAVPAAPPDSVPLVQIFDTLAAAEPLWRAMECEGVGSPYQRFDWVRAYAEALAAHEGFAVRIAVFRNPAGRPVMVLPLAVARRHGIRVASLPGGKQANFHAPLFVPGAPELADASLTALLHAAGRQMGIDAFAFINVPGAWRGEANPLVLPCAQPNPSNAYTLALDPSSETTLKRALSKEVRRTLRKKERYLAAFGSPTHLTARTPAEVDRILDAFLAQKSTRFRAAGLPNDFDLTPVQAFLRDACLTGLETGRPVIELHALAVDGRIVSTFGVTGDDRHGCGMFNSYDVAPEIARCSPGDLLLTRVIADQCARGRALFDLGVGEARYKNVFCDQTEPLFTLILPVTRRGRAYASALRRLVALKRSAKRSRWAWRAIAALRGALAKIRF